LAVSRNLVCIFIQRRLSSLAAMTESQEVQSVLTESQEVQSVPTESQAVQSALTKYQEV